MGRQPWMVTGLLRTRDLVGEISGAQLGASLTAYILTYSAMLIAYMVVLTHLAGKGADTSDPPPSSAAAVVAGAAG
jgi:cytochrome bd ubiquinol oxidase subunit I